MTDKNQTSFQPPPNARKIGAPQGPRQADQRRATLLQAAEDLFVQKGYETTTMDEIASAAHFAKGTLYHYFKNKADLLKALQEKFEQEVMQRIRVRVEHVPPQDWPGRLKGWIEAAVAAYFELNALHDVVIYGLNRPFRHAMADTEITQYLIQLLDDGARAGAWSLVDARWTAIIMFYSFRGGCDEAIMGTQDPEAVPEKLYDVFRRILGIDLPDPRSANKR